MSTFLFDKIIFGPVQSRRLGCSLGINLLPTDYKICSFDCIYCECGFNPTEHRVASMPSRADVAQCLEQKLSEMSATGQLPDVITFAGNGEPTLHRDFAGIIEDTIALRNRFCRQADIVVLTNATTIANNQVVEALLKVDQHILKMDSAFDETIQIMNQPNANFSVARLIENFAKFKGNLIIQTMFLRGNHRGKSFDNTTNREVDALIEAYRIINPTEVMIYSIARDTPISSLEKIERSELDVIAEKILKAGIKVKVS